MIFQTTVRVNVHDRYAAHVELDKIYKDRSRENRGWHHAIVDAGPGGYWALLRTDQEVFVTASPKPEAWSASPATSNEQEVTFVIQYTPKKGRLFSRFFNDDEFAIEHVRSRLQMLEPLSVELMSRQHIAISKRSIAYRAPSAFFLVTGRVQDAKAFEDVLCAGIGGSRAFGVGLPITPDSALYELALALAEA